MGHLHEATTVTRQERYTVAGADACGGESRRAGRNEPVQLGEAPPFGPEDDGRAVGREESPLPQPLPTPLSKRRLAH